MSEEPTCGEGIGGGRIEWALHRRLRARATVWGVGAGLGLTGVYFAILTAANSLQHAGDELLRLWMWMVPLVAGFSFQVGVFAYARRAVKEGGGGPHARGVVASGGASTLSMVACCAHHVTDVLPVIGFAGAVAVLGTYRDLFLLLGILSNVVGLVYALGVLRRHGLYPRDRSALSVSLRWPVDRALAPAIGLSVLVFAAALGWTMG